MGDEGVSASDRRQRRLRALFDQIGALPDEALDLVEVAVRTIAPQPFDFARRAAERSIEARSGRARFDLDRMADAIHALPGAPVMGRAIGAAR